MLKLEAGIFKRPVLYFQRGKVLCTNMQTGMKHGEYQSNTVQYNYNWVNYVVNSHKQHNSQTPP